MICMYMFKRFRAPALFRVIRFGIAGGAAVGTNLGALWIFLTLVHLPYLAASVSAFLSGFVTSFILQKFWTFQDRATKNIHQQAFVYFCIVFINLLLNTLLVYALVDFMHVLPMVAQALAAFIIAFEGFFAYRFFVFPESVKMSGVTTAKE